MTGKQRAEVYLFAAKRIEVFANSYICCAMLTAEHCITEKLPKEGALDSMIPTGTMDAEVMRINYPELWKRKPEGLSICKISWFPLTDLGRQERIRILLEAAKEAKRKRK